MTKRVPKKITNSEDIKYILNITEDNITTTFIMETFGDFNNKTRFRPYDEIIIPKGTKFASATLADDCLTTVGLWVFNKYFIEKDLFHVLGYVNQNIDSKLLNSHNKTLSYALLEDKIDTDALHKYLLKIQKFMPYVAVLCPTFTLKMLSSTKEIDKKKNELIKKYKNEIEAGDAMVVNSIQKELVEYAREHLQDDPSMDMFLSGARGTFENNFKDMFIMKGLIVNSDPNTKQRYTTAMSSYMSGISKEEYVTYCNSLVDGPYSRGLKTQFGGYQEKLFRDALQHVICLEPGSDCKTDGYIEEVLTKDNIEGFMYCYIIDNDKLVELTSDNMNKYLDKKVKMRFANKCKAKHGLCNMCVGNLYYRLGLNNIGVSLTKIPSILKNKAMKLFHDSQITFVKMDINKAFSIKK